VVGTGNATSRIKDGQRIRVDGARYRDNPSVGARCPRRSHRLFADIGLNDRPQVGVREEVSASCNAPASPSARSWSRRVR